MDDRPSKSAGAFRTIGELSTEMGVPQHMLRYWETRFPQLRPLQRAGNRRYYRPEDVALATHIHRLINQEGYTIKGVQKLLATSKRPAPLEVSTVATAPHVAVTPEIIERLRTLRARLAQALAEDDIAARL